MLLTPPEIEQAGSATADPAVWAARSAEIDSLKQSNPKLALRMAGAWLREERTAGSEEGQAWASRTRAHAFRFLGRYEVAVAAYEALRQWGPTGVGSFPPAESL